MPLYEFECENCFHKKEIKLKINELDEKKNLQFCECGLQLKLKVAPLRFTLNGAGWYANEGTGYSITQREMDKNKEITNKMDDFIH